MFENQDLVDCVEVFKKSNSTPQEIITNRIRFLLSMSRAPKKIRLDNLGYILLKILGTKTSLINMSRRP